MDESFDGMDLFQLLDLLDPAPEPLPVSWMPQTVGWIWLSLALAVLFFFIIRRTIAHRRATAYRRAAAAELDTVGDDPAKIASILRRAALAGFPREEVVSLTGVNWLTFLDQTMSGTGFADGPGSLVATAPYQGAAPEPELAALARRWIRHHKPRSKDAQ